MIKLRHITNRWDQIVMQVFGATRLVIFHQSHANALRNTAFDLTFDKQGVNRPPDIMRCCDLIKPHTAKRRINRQFNDLCAIAKYRIGNTLPLFIKRAGWRIIGFFGHKHIAIVIDRHICQGNAQCTATSISQRQDRTIKRDCGIGINIPMPKHHIAQSHARQHCRLARNKGLT